MTAPAPTTSPATGTAAGLHDQARDAYLASVRGGQPLTGTALGAQFGRSRSWGNARITEARRAIHQPQPADNQATTGRPPGTPRPEPGTTSPLPGTTSDTDSGTARRRPAWQDRAITVAVAVVSAASSYAHMLEVALLAGEPLWVARAFPITVDGLVLAALRRGHHGRHWLALGLTISIAANILANYPTIAADAGPIVSAIPPVALYGIHRLLHTDHTDGPVPSPGTGRAGAS